MIRRRRRRANRCSEKHLERRAEKGNHHSKREGTFSHQLGTQLRVESDVTRSFAIWRKDILAASPASFVKTHNTRAILKKLQLSVCQPAVSKSRIRVRHSFPAGICVRTFPAWPATDARARILVSARCAVTWPTANPDGRMEGGTPKYPRHVF